MAAANYPFGTSVENGYATNVYNPGNKDLTWETTWQHDAGIELDILKRISLEVDYYYKKTTDLLQYKQVPPSTGILQILSNSGSVINRGLEASLNVRAIQNKDFSLSFGGNISFNKNEICDFGKDPMFPTLSITACARMLLLMVILSVHLWFCHRRYLELTRGSH